MANILIADPDTHCAQALASLLDAKHTVCVVQNGDCAWKQLTKVKTELLVLDPELPGIDGITLLHKMNERKIAASVFVISRFFSDHMISVLDKLKVDYLLRKPCDPLNIAARVEEILEESSQKSLQLMQNLSRLGIPTNVKGCKYIRDAVDFMKENPDQFITKELYPAIAQKYGVTGERVERCIRNAIKLAWEKRDRMLWRSVFQQVVDTDVKKPSNSVFIARMVSLSQRQVG